jgi:hypothetical protein
MSSYTTLISLCRRFSGTGLLALSLIAIVLSSSLAEAKPGKRNLGGGLERMASPASNTRSLAPT